MNLLHFEMQRFSSFPNRSNKSIFHTLGSTMIRDKVELKIFPDFKRRWLKAAISVCHFAIKRRGNESEFVVL